MSVRWINGPPPGRGIYWIARVHEGEQRINLVGIQPAYIKQHDPDARLLMHFVGSMAYDFEANRPDITHHAVVEQPEPPGAEPSTAELIERSSVGAALRDIRERGIDAHLADLERETRPRRRRKR